MVVTSQPIQQSYFIADIAAIVALYNRVRWYRSRSGEAGSFEAATGSAVAPAVLTGTGLTPHQVNGKQFKFRVNGVTEVDLTFAAADPVTTAQAASEINGATGLVVASDVGGKLRLTTVATGSGASIEILASDAAPYLGFETGDGAVGLDADTALSGSVHDYNYTDQNSSPDFWYKVEFRHTVTGAVSGQSVALPGTNPVSVPRSNTIGCFVRLATLTGAPLVGRTLSVQNVALPNSITAASKTWGIFQSSVEVVTDADGYAVLRLLRGATVDVSIAGSGFIRRIEIPDTGDSVDLLDPSLVIEDEFGIAEFNVDFAVRTS